MFRVGSFLLRLSLAAWVGAAVLFVLTSVAEQISPDFSARTKNQLALVRFPFYYACGFGCLGTAVIAAVTCCRIQPRRRINQVVLGLTVAALLVMLADSVFVYSPLAEMMSDPVAAVETAPRDDRFHAYHNWSKYINAVGVMLAGAAACFACGCVRATDSPAKK